MLLDATKPRIAMVYGETVFPETRRPIEIVFRERAGYRRFRRLVDVIVASIALVACLPILCVAAVAIVLEDGGPIVFRQKRVGRFERVFTMYKLRTMRVSECRDSLSPSGAGDPRVTAVGRLLRRLSIDELPQLWNVLCGSMTLIGPRPEMRHVVDGYEPWQHLRHLAIPGITGLWQVTCRSAIPMHKPAATMIDLEYIRTCSFITDARILAKTVPAVLRSRGAY